MRLKNQALWDQCVANNKDPYGGCCIDVARKVMEYMDEDGPIDADALITKANDELDAGITGFMAGCVAQMAAQCHERGDEFRKSWNKRYGVEDDENGSADKPPVKGTVNPAVFTMGSKED